MKRTTLLCGAGLCVALLFVYLALLQADGQAGLSAHPIQESISPENQEVLPQPASDTVREQASPPVGTASPEVITSRPQEEPKRVMFADLPIGVRELMTQAAEKLNVPLASVTAGGIDAKLAAEFAVLVEKLRERQDEAVTGLDTEVRRVKSRYVTAGRYVQFYDETDFRAALKNKVPDGFCRLEIEGEEKGPNGPVSFFRIITVDTATEPELKAAQDTLNGLNEDRAILRDRSASLFSR